MSNNRGIRRPGLLGAQYKEMLRVDAALPDHRGSSRCWTSAPDSRPAVFHCTAGKDRTGLLSALVLSLLGVPEETVVADYALSGEAMERLAGPSHVKYPDSKDTISDIIDEVFSANPANMVDLFAYLVSATGP